MLLSDATRALVESALPDGRRRSRPRRASAQGPAGAGADLAARDRRTAGRVPAAPLALTASEATCPSQPTPLIGREAELADDRGARRAAAAVDVDRAWRQRARRGSGWQLAERLMTDFADGVFFVALQDARDRPPSPPAIAAALGVRERPDRDLETGVKEHLARPRRCCWSSTTSNRRSVRPRSSPSCSPASPRLRIIVTSRAVLHLSGEQTYEVPPLESARRGRPAAARGTGRLRGGRPVRRARPRRSSRRSRSRLRTRGRRRDLSAASTGFPSRSSWLPRGSGS